MGEDFEDWNRESLKDRLELVLDFDRTVVWALVCAIEFAQEHHIEEKIIHIPKKIMVAVENEKRSQAPSPCD
jgi:hypothetical protein